MVFIATTHEYEPELDKKVIRERSIHYLIFFWTYNQVEASR